MGYLPDSIFNFLALLGWAPKGNVEVFGRDLAIKEYELRNINRKSSVFDFDKLNFINQEHITEMPVREKFELVRPFWEEMGVDCDKLDLDYLGKCFGIMAGRGKTIKELAEFSDYLVTFVPVAARYDGSDLTDERRALLKKFNTDFLSRPELLTPEQMLAFAREWCDANGAKLKDIAMPLRYMLTGYKVSPGIFEVIELLGRDEVARRLRHYNVL